MLSTAVTYATLFVSVALCQQMNVLPTQGLCKRVPGKLNFEMPKFYGMWYQQRSFGSIMFGAYGNCAHATYSWDPIGQNILINYTQTDKGTRKLESIIGHAVLADPDQNEGKLWLIYHPEHSNRLTAATLYIVDTDYNSWAVLYSCQEVGTGAHYGRSWILTRERDFRHSPGVRRILSEIDRALQQINLNRKDYYRIDTQTNCAE